MIQPFGLTKVILFQNQNGKPSAFKPRQSCNTAVMFRSREGGGQDTDGLWNHKDQPVWRDGHYRAGLAVQLGKKGPAKISSVNPQKQIKLSTDGACIGNPGPGGWACVLRFGNHTGEMFGCEPATTNNRMELKAVIEGLKALREPCSVTICTDSQYVQRGTTEWLPTWKARGWKKSKTSKGSRVVLNQDLWMQLDKLVPSHLIQWQWVKGHADDADNVRCDSLANRAAREQICSNGIIRS
jgi:ribonuclease HI